MIGFIISAGAFNAHHCKGHVSMLYVALHMLLSDHQCCALPTPNVHSGENAHTRLCVLQRLCKSSNAAVSRPAWTTLNPPKCAQGWAPGVTYSKQGTWPPI